MPRAAPLNSASLTKPAEAPASLRKPNGVASSISPASALTPDPVERHLLATPPREPDRPIPAAPIGNNRIRPGPPPLEPDAQAIGANRKTFPPRLFTCRRRPPHRRPRIPDQPPPSGFGPQDNPARRHRLTVQPPNAGIGRHRRAQRGESRECRSGLGADARDDHLLPRPDGQSNQPVGIEIQTLPRDTPIVGRVNRDDLRTPPQPLPAPAVPLGQDHGCTRRIGNDVTAIFSARKIITMNRSRPYATHVAVRDGRILGVGDLDELTPWGDYELDDRFADKVLMPGLVEGHAHTTEGTLWQKVYCSFFDRMDPDGKVWKGLNSIDAVIARLAEVEATVPDPDTPLSGWQLDPIYLDNVRVSRHDLDRVSATRPVAVLHTSGHILNVNTKALELAGLPTGEWKGPEVMTPIGPHVGFDRAMTDCDEPGLPTPTAIRRPNWRWTRWRWRCASTRNRITALPCSIGSWRIRHSSGGFAIWTCASTCSPIAISIGATSIAA